MLFFYNERKIFTDIKNRKKLKKQKKMPHHGEKQMIVRIIFIYFASNLLSAHKMWGRTINDKKRESYGKHQQD